ncbi:proteasome inhibitor PI31 subunit isoform X1 [Neomonachus schauinslandi]|uniref:Proteasome inhibitor PI31 subunit n=1 Tax=Neomonachus schauinslandi TaxID=29088 RepID=A0A2Y9GZ95_NEOSC|nr:proteasome inhibitor PI31 subunit isoform X1 [Neomonachus schauinslandi]
MAGLEVLYASAAPAITCAQDAFICFLHWEVVTHGYYALGVGDQPGPSDKKSELLPAEWNSNKDLYVLRYESKDGSRKLLVKAVTVENSMIINVLESGSQQVSDLTLNLDDYIDSEHLADFHRTYKNSEELRSRIVSGIITPIHEPWDKASVSSPHREFPPATAREVDPLRIQPQHPHTSRQPPWCDPLGPFAVGGEDLDPFGCRRGGMIVDPLRSGFPRALIDPSSGLPNRLPPGAVPPGARFDPFGPIGTSPSGPNPDHLPPPGFDDMYL